MSRRGVIVLVVSIAAGVVVIGGVLAWLATSWLGTYRQAQTVADGADVLRAAIERRDVPAVVAAADALTGAAGDLVASTDALPWRLLEHAPVVGADAAAVGDVASATSAMLEAAVPLLPVVERVQSDGLRTTDGRVDLALVSSLAGPLATLGEVVGEQAAVLDGIDTSALRPQVADAVVSLRDEIDGLAPTLADAAEAVRRLPVFLGADGPRRWLVLLSNPAEARGTGGFPGGYVVVTADDGAISIEPAEKSTILSAVSIPVDGVPDESLTMWGDLLTTGNTFNLSPHFPLTARLAANFMAAQGEPVDGVVEIDPSTVAAMLAVTGPVELDGVTLSADNVVSFFTKDSYFDIADETHNDVVIALVREVMAQFLAASWDPIALADGLRPPVEENRVHVWSADPAEEEWLAGTAVGGVVPDSPGPVIAVAFNNAAGNKMDAFVGASVDYTVGRCPTADTQRSTVTMTLRNDAPADLPTEGGNYGRLDDPSAPAGSTKMLVHLYAPVGATFVSSTLDGAEAPAAVGADRGRPVWWTSVELDRGAEHSWTVVFDEPAVDGVLPRVIPQGMAVPEVVTVRADPSCPS